MIKERESHFQQQYGFPSNALPSQNYLTYATIQQLGETLNIHWQTLTPFYGLAWALKPIQAGPDRSLTFAGVVLETTELPFAEFAQ